MNFNSLSFLIFLPLVVTGYWLLPVRARKFWLLAASYVFYMWANPALILLLLTSTVVDYFCGRGIEAHRQKPGAMRAMLLLSICVNLGLLFTFKYFDFFAETVNSLTALAGLSYRVPQLGLILPVGISFYTFQTMSYTIDVYRGDYPAETDPVVFALYVSYFPQLVAGPIENPASLLPQLKAEHRVSWADLTAGGRILLLGFFRKCVVADVLGIYVNAVFSAPDDMGGPAILWAGALFCFQMYCDFAGYSEIATGCARMMGVRLSRNFDRPYLSQSYTEFFRRWHITLNRWFTSYVYIPLGGNRRGTARRMLNTVIVFFLCGLWHGANWTYVLWGLYAAFWLCLESVTVRPWERRMRTRGDLLDRPAVKLARRLVMFAIFIPAALLFRAPDLESLGVILSRLTVGWGVPADVLSSAMAQMGMDVTGLVRIALCLIAMAALERFGAWEPSGLSGDPTAAARRLVSQVYVILVIAISWLSLLALQANSQFAYFQF